MLIIGHSVLMLLADGHFFLGGAVCGERGKLAGTKKKPTL